VTSSGIAAKVLSDLDWIVNRETPVVLSLLVMEDLTIALYLPILTAAPAGARLLDAFVAIAIALAVVTVAVLLFVRCASAVPWRHSSTVPAARSCCSRCSD
jgi:CPA2 family monovalent cation:H+ antiporter-2